MDVHYHDCTHNTIWTARNTFDENTEIDSCLCIREAIRTCGPVEESSGGAYTKSNGMKRPRYTKEQKQECLDQKSIMLSQLENISSRRRGIGENTETNILDRKDTRTLFTGPKFFCVLGTPQIWTQADWRLMELANISSIGERAKVWRREQNKTPFFFSTEVVRWKSAHL